jgi:REP element-mobilizing transposase RayT
LQISVSQITPVFNQGDFFLQSILCAQKFSGVTNPYNLAKRGNCTVPMASSQYFIRNQNETYFLTMTVVDWIDVFTRREHKLKILDSLRYCQENKGLIIYGWCLMSNHLHLLVAAKESFHLSDILRDFKKFTSKQLVLSINTEIESRRDWMLYRFEYAGKFMTNVKSTSFGRMVITQKNVTAMNL